MVFNQNEHISYRKPALTLQFSALSISTETNLFKLPSTSLFCQKHKWTGKFCIFRASVKHIGSLLNCSMKGGCFAKRGLLPDALIRTSYFMLHRNNKDVNSQATVCL